MAFSLGLDIGTTFTAVGIARVDRVEIAPLGTRGWSVPSVVYLSPDQAILVGEAAERRASSTPFRVVREFKRRIGDPVPLIVGGSPMSAQALTGRLAQAVVRQAVALETGPPDHIVVTHPANWGPYKIDCLWQAIRIAELDQQSVVSLMTEPEAAAAYYASNERLAVGDVIAVYDLGGGTFDATVLRRTSTSWETLAPPEGVEHLGGIDFDEALRSYVDQATDGRVHDLDPADADAVAVLRQLRRDCVEAKEALSSDIDATIRVALAGYHAEVRITRAEFEAMVQPSLDVTVEALRRVLRSAGITPSQLHSVLLVGGSSRIPLVSETIERALKTRVMLDVHPKHAVALGAALTGFQRANAEVPQPGLGHRADPTGSGRSSRLRPDHDGPSPVPNVTDPSDGRESTSPINHPDADDNSAVPRPPLTAAVASAPIGSPPDLDGASRQTTTDALPSLFATGPQNDSNNSDPPDPSPSSLRHRRHPARLRWIAAAVIAAVVAGIITWTVIAAPLRNSATPASEQPSQLASTQVEGSDTAGSESPQPSPTTVSAQVVQTDACQVINGTWPDLQGTDITYFTDGGDSQLQASLKPFENCTGVNIVTEAAAGPFDLQERASNGDLPDLASISQPGVLTELARTPGVVRPVPESAVNIARQNYDAMWLDVGTVDGTPYALPLDALVKSLIWYSPEAFKQHGLTVPRTYQELVEISDKLVASGSTPWCVGVGPGWDGAWPASDWLEDMMLRLHGPQIYDQWVEHSIPFDDQRVASALLAVQRIVKNPQYVNGGFGGPDTIGTTPVNEAGMPILTENCFLHHRDSGYQISWPSGTDIDENGDVWVFTMPAVSPDKGAPILVGGRYTAAFSDRPEVQALQYYLTSSTWANAFTAAGTAVTANKAADPSHISSPMSRLAVDLMHGPETIRFDASDQVPPEVGHSTEPDALYRWITDSQDAADALADIEQAWPTS